jgi:hypothetical protein
MKIAYIKIADVEATEHQSTPDPPLLQTTLLICKGKLRLQCFQFSPKLSHVLMPTTSSFSQSVKHSDILPAPTPDTEVEDILPGNTRVNERTFELTCK